MYMDISTRREWYEKPLTIAQRFRSNSSSISTSIQSSFPVRVNVDSGELLAFMYVIARKDRSGCLGQCPYQNRSCTNSRKKKKLLQEELRELSYS
jgi:hypothetical protein